MHPTTPAQGLVLTPVSPAIAALLHELQAQIIAEAAERATAPAGEITLPPPGTWRLQARDADDTLHWQDADYNAAIRAYRRRHKPASWGSETPWHPAWFTVYFERRDSLGHTWNRYGGDYVTDDFGTLQPVPYECRQ